MCVVNVCQWCQRCEMLPFFSKSSISDISYSASLTPSAPKSPHFSILWLPSPFCFSLLFDHPSSATPSCPISVSPSLPPSLPPSLHFSFSSHYFHWFSNMSFHRLLPPVSWGRRRGLLVLLVRQLVKLSGTSYYDDVVNNGFSCWASALPLLLRNGSCSAPLYTSFKSLV